MRQLAKTILAGMLAAVLAAGTAVPALAADVLVFAAASLKTGLDEFAARWQAQTGNTVTVSYAGSGKLAKQIEAGAPADLFISANTAWADEVEQAGLVVPGGRRDILANTLVLIAHGKDAARVEIRDGFDLPSLLGDGKLAMAMVDSVPAGIYGKESLTALGLWDVLAPSVAQADNVRAALALVASGEAPYGIVYATDAAASDNVTVVGTFPADSHPPIIYPALLLTNAADEADRAFFTALTGTMAREAFTKQGFRVLK
ncbi:molybdate ABC transporter substrate-binding protein [Zhengella mangrovi]|uniref:Molybdate ABC transporter substrate-binding protein n=1 Tax=Zhengella mangrovi TaxID=1982044 RepID=A0A2G1QNC2_9HYPH|nr:molybdate ABC transporter substrate-binding protein [Zhengella mangrovi]PHP66979.1 molybdate ABC transporter substrate-binding protein [Zhengella mangrovi]